jgi:hypothetical protein
MDATLLDFVLSELEARKGSWPDIAKAMAPQSWKSYYSWMEKVARGQIPDPGVSKIQELADYFRGIDRSRPTTEQAAA